MSLRLRTVWLEIGAGFHLLAASMAAFRFRDVDGLMPTSAFSNEAVAIVTMTAASAVFLLHSVRASRAIRRFLFLAAGFVALVGAVRFLSSGDFMLVTLQFGYGAWLLAAAAIPCFDQCIQSTDTPRLRGLYLFCGAVLAVVGAAGLVAGGGDDAWLRMSAAAGAIAVGAALIWVEVRGRERLRPAAALLAATGFLTYAAVAYAREDFGAAGAPFVIFVMLVLSAIYDERLPESADDYGGTTPRQREIYAYERAGEATIWVSVSVFTLLSPFVEGLDRTLFHVAVLMCACVTVYSYRLRPASLISDRKYLLTLLGVGISLALVTAASGGATGPFFPLAYLTIFAGTFVIRPIWSIAVSALYACLVLFEFARRFVRDEDLTEGQVARYVFLGLSLLITGFYTAWAGRRRGETESSLYVANRRIAETLRKAVRDREASERKTQDLRSLNQNLLEMRSALMNVLEDVEQSKRQIELERRREVASFNALAEGVIAAGKDGKVFLCNPMASRVLGVPASAIIGQSIESSLRLFQEDSPVLQTRAFEEAYAGRTVALGEHLRLSRADGSHVPVSGTVAPYFDEENRATGVVAAFRDVTVEREVDRQKSDFISIASHQLRTPLSALRWFLDLLLAGDAGKLKPMQKEYLGDMSTSVERMIMLVGDLLNVSRLESGGVKPNPERIETHAFVESLAREFAPLVAQQRVDFSTDVAKDAVSFFADPSMARQALANLISNAVKYTPSGGSVTLDAVVAGRETVFTVTDTGLGIPKAQQYRIFDKFFRGENVVAKETVGSGLGLYVVKTIVDVSGGRIWYESMEKRGTSFHLSFPNGPAALPGGAGGGTLTA